MDRSAQPNAAFPPHFAPAAAQEKHLRALSKLYLYHILLVDAQQRCGPAGIDGYFQ